MSDTTIVTTELPNYESAFSAVSWGAIVAGAVAAVATSAVLLTLGPGIGLTAVSAYPGASASAAAVGIGAAIWVIVVQWLSSAMGGYLTGRMRAKWAASQTDEVFFRDTAHGFLAWGLATLITVTIFVHSGLGVLSMGASAVGGAASVAASAAPDDYAMDTLFRSAPSAEGAATSAAAPVETTTEATAPATGTETAAPAADSTTAPAAEGTATTAPPAAASAPTAVASTAAPVRNAEDVRAEAGRIFARGLGADLSAEDRTYLAQLIASQSGISQQDAEARVDQTIASARETAEAARKATASAAILAALALVIGAFVGAAAGGLGGRHRDEL